MSRTRTQTAIACLAVGAGLLGPALVAAPASANANCSVSYDNANGGAVAICSSGGEFRVKITCNAVWPFPSWTKYSPWTSSTPIGICVSFSSSVFPSCPSPATNTKSVQYR